MKSDYSLYKSHISFGIISGEIDPDVFSKELDIKPHRSFKKGEQIISAHSGSIITKPHNLWEIASKPLICEEESLEPHINYIRTMLAGKMNILKQYKHDPRIETIFWIWMETENGGIGIDLIDTDVSFFNEISNRIHFTFLAKDSIDPL